MYDCNCLVKSSLCFLALGVGETKGQMTGDLLVATGKYSRYVTAFEMMTAYICIRRYCNMLLPTTGVLKNERPLHSSLLFLQVHTGIEQCFGMVLISKNEG